MRPPTLADTDKTLREQLAKTDKTFGDQLASTEKTLRDLLINMDKRISEIGSKQNALFLLFTGTAAIVTFFIGVGKAVGWF